MLLINIHRHVMCLKVSHGLYCNALSGHIHWNSMSFYNSKMYFSMIECRNTRLDLQL